MKWYRCCIIVIVLSFLSPLAIAENEQFSGKSGDAAYQDALTRAYRYDKKGARGEALKWYQRATATAANAQQYNQACMGVVYDAPLQRKRLPEPWYLTFYADTMQMQRRYAPQTTAQQDFNDTLLQSKLRLGRYLDASHKTSLYGYVTYNTDSASHGGGVPQIYNDNYTGLGVGVDYRPLSGMRLYAEAGQDYDLNNVGRSRWRTDLTLGADYFHGWGPGQRCSYDPVWRMHPFADLYISVARYGRYDGNVISQVTARAGERLFDYRYSNISAYMLIDTTADSKNLYYNNTLEIGPGVSWRPYIAWPISLRLEYRYGQYWRDLPANYSKQYRTLLLQAIIYFEQ